MKNLFLEIINFFDSWFSPKSKSTVVIKNRVKTVGHGNQVDQKSRRHIPEIYDDYCVVDGETIFFGHLIKKGDTPNIKIYGKKILVNGHIYNWRTKKFEKK